MTSTFLLQLHAGTPTVSIRDNRGLAVRELAWRRTLVGGTTDICITRHQYNIHGQLVQSIDPRLYAAKQLDDRVKPNFTWHYDLAGSPLRMESVDGGGAISLSDVEGRPLLAVTAMDITQRWHYEDDTLPGRPLAASELKPGQVTPSITERFIWAGNTQAEKDHNLVGQCVCHYDTAGLNRLDSLSLTGATLSQSRQLLADDQEAHWEGSSEDTWQAMLAEKIYFTQSTTDATGATLIQTDAMGNQQRLAYDVAGQLMGSWLTLADDDEQVIVKSLMYSAAGQKLREEHGNGVVTEYIYELETQRLTGITTCRPAGHSSGAKLLQDLRYEYDPVGNVVSLRNDAEATQFWRNQKVVPENTYTYDTLYQLIGATGREMANIGRQGSQLPALTTPLPADNSVYTNYTRTYTYDPGGNLSQIQHCAPATNNNYTTDITVSNRSNRAVLSQPGLTPEGVDALFDAGGHQRSLLSDQPLVWNSRGELQQVTPVNREEGASDQERYRYGGDGMRVLKIRERQTKSAMQIQRVTYLPGLELRTTHNGTTTTEDLHVLTVGEAGRAQVRVLHWESKSPSGICNNQIRYSYDNLIGSSGLELDGEGDIISQEEYYPYGGTAVWAARSQIEADYKTVRYSGKERDATGLYYYGYRYYQPWVGRWLNPDPAGTIDGLNLFRMVRNNTVRWQDKDGRWTNDEWDKIAQQFVNNMPFGQRPAPFGVADAYPINQGGPVNVFGLKQNCYYCTVAALSRKTTHDLVGDTEEMQQDTAPLDTIDELFWRAGLRTDRRDFIAQNDVNYAGEGRVLAWSSTYAYLDNHLQPGETAGLAYAGHSVDAQGHTRAEGHMIAIQKFPDNKLYALDYQSGIGNELRPDLPPEQRLQESYHVYLLGSRLSVGHDRDAQDSPIPDALDSHRFIMRADRADNSLQLHDRQTGATLTNHVNGNGNLQNAHPISTSRYRVWAIH